MNISMVQCLRQNLTETIRPVLENYHIPPSMLTLEVTERTAIGAPERMLWHMHELGKWECRLRSTITEAEMRTVPI